jgi:hypothetical protein
MYYIKDTCSKSISVKLRSYPQINKLRLPVQCLLPPLVTATAAEGSTLAQKKSPASLVLPHSQLKNMFSHQTNPSLPGSPSLLSQIASIQFRGGDGWSGHPAQLILPRPLFSRIRAASRLTAWTSGHDSYDLQQLIGKSPILNNQNQQKRPISENSDMYTKRRPQTVHQRVLVELQLH